MLGIKSKVSGFIRESVRGFLTEWFEKLDHNHLELEARLVEMEKRLARIELESDVSTRNLHAATFLPFKDINRGKEIVVVATGPSAAKYKPIKNALHLGVNRAFKLEGVDFDYLFIQDYRTKTYLKEANAYRKGQCQKFYGLVVENDPRHVVEDGEYHDFVIPNEDAEAAGALRYRTDLQDLRHANECRFRYDLTSGPLGDFWSIAFPALQFALWTHPKRIYLVGCDCSNAGYFGSGGSSNSLGVDCTIDAYLKLKTFARRYYSDVEIVSINPVGLKGIFRDVYTEESGAVR